MIIVIYFMIDMKKYGGDGSKFREFLIKQIDICVGNVREYKVKINTTPHAKVIKNRGLNFGEVLEMSKTLQILPCDFCTRSFADCRKDDNFEPKTPRDIYNMLIDICSVQPNYYDIDVFFGKDCTEDETVRSIARVASIQKNLITSLKTDKGYTLPLYVIFKLHFAIGIPIEKFFIKS